jgi:hypothetical protein
VQGAPFTPHRRWTYVGRDNRGCEFPEIGLRMYIVDSRVFIVQRRVHGVNHTLDIDLLRCEQSDESGCQAFGYKYRGVIFTCGIHCHD